MCECAYGFRFSSCNAMIELCDDLCAQAVHSLAKGPTDVDGDDEQRAFRVVSKQISRDT